MPGKALNTGTLSDDLIPPSIARDSEVTSAIAAITATDVGAIASTEKGAANGVATLGADSKIPLIQIPSSVGGGEFNASQIRIGSHFIETTSSAYLGSAPSNSGTVAAVASEPDHPGIAGPSTGTLTNGIGLLRTLVNAFRFGSFSFDFSTELYLPTLSDGTNTFVARIGFQNGAAPPTAGAFFEYDTSLSPNWQCRTHIGAAGGQQTIVNSGVAVSTAWTKFEISVPVGAANVVFKINGSIVATITTTIPQSVGQEFGLGFQIAKSAGTTARTIAIDWYKLNGDKP